jgi:hypothetical protein
MVGTHQALPKDRRRDSAFGFIAPYRDLQHEVTGGVRGTAVAEKAPSNQRVAFKTLSYQFTE